MASQRDPEGIESKYLHKFADFADGRVLEVGCGDGRLTRFYANTAKQVVGIDAHGEELGAVLHLDPPGLTDRVDLAQASAEALPFQPQSFNLAILAWSL